MKRWGMGAKDSDLRSVEIRATYVEDESTFSPHADGYPDVNDIFGEILDIMRVDELDLGAESCDGSRPLRHNHNQHHVQSSSIHHRSSRPQHHVHNQHHMQSSSIAPVRQ